MATDPTSLVWILTCSALVMLMQAGFLLLEIGMARSKNSINVAIKNLTDFCIAFTLFWAAGFAIMFGASTLGIVGVTDFFLLGLENNSARLAFFVFQAMFCGTAVTIISGAVAERTRFKSYIVIALIISVLIYPVLGHWIWAGNDGSGGSGWLQALGFIDFAGSTVVHSVGGWVALAAVLIIGPRIGRFDQEDGAPALQGHNLTLATLGTLLLWFGWFGFNGGSAPDLDRVPLIIVNTSLAAGAGGIIGLALSWRLLERPDVVQIMNGVLGGLVAITASANIQIPLVAAFIGAAGGAISFGGSFLLVHLKIDDVVGVIPVHCFSGVWGTLAVALFADTSHFGGNSRPEQILIQLLGIAATALWAFGLSFLFLWLINRRWPLRVSREDEIEGLNVSEHGASTELIDLLTDMEGHRTRGDFSAAVRVEPHTEVGQIARQYNDVLDKFNEQVQKVAAIQDELIGVEKMAGLGVMAAGVAHEINNPLQAVISLSEAILVAKDDTYVKEDAKELQLAAERIQLIVKDLSDYSRSAQALQVEAVDLEQVVIEALKLVGHSRLLHQVQVEMNFETGLEVLADSTELIQVVVNLVHNSIDAMETGGVLQILTRSSENYIDLEMTDDGAGMDDETIRMLFDPFFTTKDIGKGTGLGMFVVQRIMTKYSGLVEVESAPNEGTTMKLRFPLRLDEPQ